MIDPIEKYWAWSNESYLNTWEDESKVSIWLSDGTSIVRKAVSVVIDEAYTFKDLEPGKEYTVFAGCIDSTMNVYNTNACILTYKIEAKPNYRTATTHDFNLKCNYPCTIEYWIDDQTRHYIAEYKNVDNEYVLFDGILFEELKDTPNTMYIQVAEIPDTKIDLSLPHYRELKSFNIECKQESLYIAPVFTSGSSEGMEWKMGIRRRDDIGQPNPKFYDGYAFAYNLDTGLDISDYARGTDYIVYFTVSYNNSAYIKQYTYIFTTPNVTIDDTEIGTNSIKFLYSIIPLKLIDVTNNSEQILSKCVLHVKSNSNIGSAVAMYNEIPKNMTISEEFGYVEIKNLDMDKEYDLFVYITQDENDDISENTIAYKCLPFNTKLTAEIEPIVSKITGRSISILPYVKSWNGATMLKIKCSLYTASTLESKLVSTKWCNLTPKNTNSPFEFAGLDNGKAYKAVFDVYDSEDNKIDLKDIIIKTYGLILSLGDPHSSYVSQSKLKYIDAKIDGIFQEKNMNVRWYITPSDDSNKVLDTGVIAIGNSLVTEITTNNKKLQPEHTYNLYAFIEDVIYNGNSDTLISIPFITSSCAKGIQISTQATGTTITCDVSWRDPGLEGYSLNVLCMLMSGKEIVRRYEITSAGNSNIYQIQFTGLKLDTEYSVVPYAYDNEGNTSDDRINFIDPDSETYYVKSLDVTERTYSVEFGDINVSTSAVNCRLQLNKELENTIYEYQLIKNMDQNVLIDWVSTHLKSYGFNIMDLDHDTFYTLKVRIKDMYDENGKNDCVNEIQFKTQKLEGLITVNYTTLDHLSVSVVGIVNGSKRKYDSVTDVTYRITKAKLYNIDNPRYAIYGSISDFNISFSGLTPNTKYKPEIWITDGHNTVLCVEDILQTYSSSMMIYSKDGDEMIKALPYVFDGKRFVKAQPHIFTDNRWVATDY